MVRIRGGGEGDGEGREKREGWRGKGERGGMERGDFCRQMYTLSELSLAVLNSTITQYHAYRKYAVSS